MQELMVVDVYKRQELDLSPFQRKEIKDIIRITEEVFTEDAESIVINERYAFIERVCQMAQSHTEDFALTLSDKIDRIVTNRWLALPIFAAVMWLVYYVSVSTVGTWATDWANDGLFGDGFRLFGRDVPGIPVIIGNALDAVNCAGWLQSLILDGIVAGVGAVLGFVPQMLVLFIFLAFLESCGYIDVYKRQVYSSTPSFIPKNPTANGYEEMLTTKSTTFDFMQWTVNSVIVSLLTTLFSMVIATLGGYGISRFRFRGRNALSYIILTTQVLPGSLLIIPLYIIMGNMQLLDTRMGLVMADVYKRQK